jgi:hypothetical protein
MSVHLISVQLPVPDFSCYLVVLVVVWFFFCFIHLISPYWLGKYCKVYPIRYSYY